MRLATWEKSAPNEYLGFAVYTSSADTCSHLWLNFRDEDAHSQRADTIRDFGVYVWISDDTTISFTSKFHDIHSADMEKLADMVKFLKKHKVYASYKLEGKQHLKMILKEILAQLKVTEQTNYPSDNITKVDFDVLANKIAAFGRSHWETWIF